MPWASAERAAVAVRAHAGGPLEPVAERGRRAEADLGADAFHRVARRLQQVLGLADAGPVQPLERRGPGLLAEVPDQRAGARARVGRDVREGQVAAQVV